MSFRPSWGIFFFINVWGLSIIQCCWGINDLLHCRLNCRSLECEIGDPRSSTKNGVGQRECSFHMLSPLTMSSVGVPSWPAMRLASLPRHRGRGVSVKLTRVLKNHQGHEAKRNAPKLTIGGELQRKDELVVTRSLCFHILWDDCTWLHFKSAICNACGVSPFV